MSRQVITTDVVDDKFTTYNLSGELTTNDRQSGYVFIISEDEPTKLILPLARVGLNYKIYISVNMTNTFTIENNTDMWRASLWYIDDNNGVSSFNMASTTEGFVQYLGHNNYIADSDTKGRLNGSLLTIRCFKEGEWYLQGQLIGNGAIGNPFEDME